MAEWREISVRVASAEADTVESIFTTCGALAVTVSSAEQTQEIFDLLDREYRLWRFVQVTGLFSEDVDCESILVALNDNGVSDEFVEVDELEDQDWVLRWQQAQKPLDFGHGLFICPPDVTPPADAERIIVLEPGMAFGTGTHPTTRMCLRWIAAKHWHDDSKAIDFGCGSGVLAIAMARCGAGNIVGCDIDPQAIEVARANASLNQVGQIKFCENDALPPNPLPSDKVNAIIANILLEPLIKEKPHLDKHLQTGGELVLSGILDNQADRLIAEFAPEFALEVTSVEEGWALVVGTKKLGKL